MTKAHGMQKIFPDGRMNPRAAAAYVGLSESTLAILRCRVQLQIEITRHGLPLTRTLASGTRSLVWPVGQGGSRAEQ